MILPHTSIQGAMVGSPQAIQCIVSTVSGVESSLVMISWKGPNGPYTSNSRISVEIDGLANHNIYYSTLQFVYLMEGDEGIYTCSVTILDTVNLKAAKIESLTSKHYIHIYYLSLSTIVLNSIIKYDST